MERQNRANGKAATIVNIASVAGLAGAPAFRSIPRQSTGSLA